jgi:GNAT superfamily N-acetyltransferase
MIHLRTMTRADVPFGMALKEQAGWNQTAADWLRFLDMEPDGCFVAELEGQLAGTVTNSLFGSVAWVSMVLVDSALRGRGIGTAMMERALFFLEERGARTIRLDATPLGQPIYEKLGFVADYTLASYVGVPQFVAPSDQVRPMSQQDLTATLTLDRAVTGTDRETFVGRLFAEHPTEARVIELGGRVASYLLARPGSLAWRIGPCLGDVETGRLLLEDACHRHSGQPVVLDIPLDLSPASAVAEAMGLRELRRLTRMSRGAPVGECVDGLWCSSGPEKG